jgi:hypothetical protein
VVIRRGTRALSIGTATYRWGVSHSHGVDELCTETMAVRRDGAPNQLAVRFVAGPDRYVPDGLLHAGGVIRGHDYLNLHRPGVARALIDEALARGWRYADPGRTEVDGWSLVDAVLPRIAPDPS